MRMWSIMASSMRDEFTEWIQIKRRMLSFESSMISKKWGQVCVLMLQVVNLKNAKFLGRLKFMTFGRKVVIIY